MPLEDTRYKIFSMVNPNWTKFNKNITYSIILICISKIIWNFNNWQMNLIQHLDQDLYDNGLDVLLGLSPSLSSLSSELDH